MTVKPLPLKRTAPPQRGVTLLEVLVAIVIFGIGVLGVVGLNLSGQKTNQQAYQALIAHWKAQELVEIMQANMSPANQATYLFSYSASHALPATDCATATAECDENEIAAWDVAIWYSSLRAALTATASAAASGAASSPGGPLDKFTIHVIWDARDDKQQCGLIPGESVSCISMEFSQ